LESISSKQRLIVICEGQAHMIEYLHTNGVYPDMVILDAIKVKELAPYLLETDEILLIIKGLTDFTMSEVYMLLSDLQDFWKSVKSVNVFSNVYIGKVPFKYYMYSGDLFYGDVSEVEDGKIKEKVKVKSVQADKGKKSVEKGAISEDTSNKNTFIKTYKKYGNRGVKLQIFGRKLKDIPVVDSVSTLEEKIVIVDIFN